GMAHARRDRPWVAAVRDAGPAGALGDLLPQALFESAYIGFGENPFDASISRDVRNEVVDHRRNGVVATEPVIERPALGEGTGIGEGERSERDSERAGT